MTQEETRKPISRWPRRLWLMSPSLVVLAGILLFNWYFYFRLPAPTETAVIQPTQPATVTTETAVTPQPAAPAPQPTQPPTPLPTPTPSLPTEAPPTLLGPPNNAIFTAQDSATFYWHYPDLLPDGYQFTVYIQQDDAVFAAASLNEPNLGLSYRAAVPLTFDVSQMTTLNWWVQIETSQGTAVSRSEIRALRLIPSQN